MSQDRLIHAALRTAKQYAEGGTISDETPPPPAALSDYGAPTKSNLPEEATAYPEWTMGNTAEAGEFPKVGPVPFEIGPKPKEERGIVSRVVEGAKGGWGESPTLAQQYPYLAPFIAPVNAIETGLRGMGAGMQAASGLGAGVAEKLGMDRSGADKLERDLNILNQYPGNPGGPHIPGAATFAKMRAGEVARGAGEVAKELNPIQEGAAGAFGGKLKQPDFGKPEQWSTKSPASTYDLPEEALKDFKKVGPQMGSNPGGLYENSHGEQFYVKNPKTADHARNEMLAVKLYQAAGTPIPDVKLAKFNGKDAIVSPIVEGDALKHISDLDYAYTHGLHDNFVVDAWLGNYDSVGTGKDNIVVDANGVAHRIDMGGALRYRAQGKLKDKFGPKVDELETMKDPSINADAAEVFSGMSYDDLLIGAMKVAKVSDEEIRTLVQKYGPIHQNQKAVDKLADTLIARKQDIIKRFGLDEGEAPKGTPEPSGGLPEKLPEFTDKEYQAGMEKLVETARGDTEAIASALFDIANKYGHKVADGFMHKLPQEHWADIDHYLDAYAQAAGKDPWADVKTHMVGKAPEPEAIERPWKPKEYTYADLAEYEAMQDQQFQKEKSISTGEAFQLGGEGVVAKMLMPVSPKDILAHLPEQDIKYSYKLELPDEFVKSLGNKANELIPFWLFKGGNQYKGIEHGHYQVDNKLSVDPKLAVPKEKYPHEVPSIEEIKKTSMEHAFFAAVQPQTGHGYGDWVQPYIGFAKNPAVIDFKATFGDPKWTLHRTQQIIKYAKSKGHDVVFATNMDDNYHVPNATDFKWNDRLHTQVLFLDTKGKLNSPHAELKDWESHLVHSGLAGVGMVGTGLLLHPGQAEAQEQPIQKKASGGAVGSYTHPIKMKKGGMLNSPIPGRTDKIPVNVPAGSYVLPADIPSAIGQGNSMAGAEILKKMFSSGPYGMAPMKGRSRPPLPPRWMNPPKIPRLMKADGGEVEPEPDQDERVPIIAAGGEYILNPEVVAAIGNGSMTEGHKVLDKFVLDVRKHHIKTLKGLKPPKK